MATYEGMRWVKCDFQVQTPEDAAHWADAETRLSEPRRPLADQPPRPTAPRLPAGRMRRPSRKSHARSCNAVTKSGFKWSASPTTIFPTSQTRVTGS